MLLYSAVPFSDMSDIYIYILYIYICRIIYNYVRMVHMFSFGGIF